MTVRRGRCKNYKNCHYADDRRILEVDDKAFICPNPECKKPLVPVHPDSTAPPLPTRWIGVAALVLLGAAAVVYFLLNRPPSPPSDSPPAESKSASAWVRELSFER